MAEIFCTKSDVHYHVEMLDRDMNEANIVFTLGGKHDDENDLTITDLPPPLADLPFDAENMYSFSDQCIFHDVKLSAAVTALEEAGFTRGEDW